MSWRDVCDGFFSISFSDHSKLIFLTKLWAMGAFFYWWICRFSKFENVKFPMKFSWQCEYIGDGFWCKVWCPSFPKLFKDVHELSILRSACTLPAALSLWCPSDCIRQPAVQVASFGLRKWPFLWVKWWAFWFFMIGVPLIFFPAFGGWY